MSAASTIIKELTKVSTVTFMNEVCLCYDGQDNKIKASVLLSVIEKLLTVYVIKTEILTCLEIRFGICDT